MGVIQFDFGGVSAWTVDILYYKSNYHEPFIASFLVTA